MSETSVLIARMNCETVSPVNSRGSGMVRHTAVALLALLFSATAMTLLTVPALSAQGTSVGIAGMQNDARWQPWLGCWKPMGGMTPVSGGMSEIPSTVSTQLMCVVPGSTAGSVDIVNFSGGAITDRTTVIPGQSIAKDVDGCAGAETATWSGDGHRVLMRGTYRCGNGVTRTESGVMSIDVDGQWVQTQSININGNASVYVAQFRDAGIAMEGIRDGAIVELPVLDESGARLSPPRDGCAGTESVVPSADGQRVVVTSDYLCPGGLHRIANADMRRGADGRWIRADGQSVPFGNVYVRAAAGAPVSLDDVLEVSKAVDPMVAEAWVTSREQQFALSGNDLVRMADNGMPPRVIDLLVAVSNPQVFTLRRKGAETIADPRIAQADDRRSRRMGDDCYAVSQYCYGMMGLSWLYGADRYYGWNAYGYNNGLYYGNRYGYNYGNGYSGPGYYTGNGPVVIVPRETEQRGKAVYGQGYTRGSGSSGSSGRSVYGSPSWPASSGAGASGSTSSGSSSSGSSSSGSSSEGSSSSGSSTGRTAVPRGSKPPDGL